jgi:1-acyl-sn-glycerol-3-phosphate acyltransferase
MEWRLKPARDLGLSFGERLTSQRREFGLAATATHWCWRQLVRFYLRRFHRLEVTGLERLPMPPFVMIANHASHLDALVLSSALPTGLADRAYPIAAGDTFFTSFTASAFAVYTLNALPMWRRTTRPADLQALRTRLSEDRLIFVLFPEGTRSRDGQMAHFKPGIGALVTGSTIPVVPCYLEGAHAAWPPQRRFPRAGRLRLSIGAPLSFSELANERAAWSLAAEKCEEAVRNLGSARQR